MFSLNYAASKVSKIRITLYSVQIWENADQNNSEYDHFLRSARNSENFKYKCNKILVKLLKRISFLVQP